MQILAGIVLLGVLIVFHELGHFLVAKALGVKVLVFSVGFGPKLWGITKNGTEYRLSAIPLGGYIRMFGESIDEDLTDAEKKQSFMHQAIWKKSLIAFAGPLFNFILPIILFFFLLVGKEQVLAPRIGTLVKDGAADKAGLKVGDLINTVNGQHVVSFNELADIIAKNPEVDLNIDLTRSTAQGVENIDLMVKPEGRSSSNPLEKDQQVGRIGIMPAIERPIVMVSDKSPWQVAGLKSFDEIKMIGDQEIHSGSELLQALKDIKPGALLEIERPKEAQRISIHAPVLSFMPVDLNIAGVDQEKTRALIKFEQEMWQKNRGLSLANGAVTELTEGSIADKLGLRLKSRIISFDGERFLSTAQIQQAMMNDGPHTLGVIDIDGDGHIFELSVPKSVIQKMDLNSDVEKTLGFALADVFKPGETIERMVGPIEALKRALSQTASIVFMTAKSFWLLVNRDVPASQIGGPIMLFDVAQQAAQKGLAFYIFIMSLLSVNLGLLNLLPIPALDGGHLLLFAIEAVQGKPLTAKTRTIATQIGIAILLSLMAFALFNDLSRIFR